MIENIANESADLAAIIDDLLVAARSEESAASPTAVRRAIARLKEEYEKNPEGRLFVHLAEAYRRAGELEKARKVLNEGLERHSDYLSARIVLAQVETELGDTDRALEVWREVTQLDPDNELALWALAELEYNDGNAEQSLGYYRRLADLGVDDAELDEMITLLETTVSEGGATAAPSAGTPAEPVGATAGPSFGAGAASDQPRWGGSESGRVESERPSPSQPPAGGGPTSGSAGPETSSGAGSGAPAG